MAETKKIEDFKEEYFEKYKRHKVEIGKNQMQELDWPKPVQSYRWIVESHKQSIEESYYWLLDYLKYDLGYFNIEKITDVLAASETSAFGGVAQQRLGMHQDKVTQFLTAVGKMVKDLFQMVRELRVLDERLAYYKDADKYESAEITLKGVYVDMAEGGAKSPASVYGMARELQFTTLPDLFFGTHPRTVDEVEEMVDKLDFNPAVKRVLKRKLYSFIRWKKETFKELNHRRNMNLKYLRQHYDIIRLYLNWVRPYLRSIKQLQSTEKGLRSAELISSFEGALIEIEFLAKFLPEGNKDYFAVILVNCQYRTRPSMDYHSDYQRGPLHVGEITFNTRGYTWTEKDIEAYKNLRELDDLELIKSIDNSIKEAMDSLGEDLKKYIEEAGGELTTQKKEGEKSEAKQPGVLDPFVSIFKGAGELTKAFGAKDKKPTKKPKDEQFRIKNEKSAAKGAISNPLWLLYKNYKKSHKMIAW